MGILPRKTLPSNPIIKSNIINNKKKENRKKKKIKMFPKVFPKTFASIDYDF